MPFVVVFAVCFTTLPVGVVSVNVTLAPETGDPPFSTVAAIATVLGGLKLEPDTERLIVREGALTTVRLPVAAPT